MKNKSNHCWYIAGTPMAWELHACLLWVTSLCHGLSELKSCGVMF